MALAIGSCLLLTGSVLPEPVHFKKIQLQGQVSKASSLFQAGRFEAGLGEFERALRTAQDNGDVEWSIKLRSNMGGAYYALYRYQEAIGSFLSARKEALAAGRVTLAAVIDVNLASLNIVLGDLDTAGQFSEEALRIGKGSDLRGHRYQLLACVAELRAKQGRRAEAVEYFREAAKAANRAGDTPFVARIWDHVGELMLREGDLRAAEEPLLEAFRLRTLFHDRDLRVSFLNVAWLRMEQGDVRSAAALMARTGGMPTTDTGSPPWFESYLRGRLAQKSGYLQQASQYYGIAFQEALEWQDQVGPSDNLRGVSFAREEFQRLYEALVETSLATDPQRAIDAFEATEVYRAAALRQTLSSNRQRLRGMPPGYWVLLNRLRAAKTAELTRHSDQNAALVSTLKLNMLDFQSEHITGGSKTFEKYRTGQALRGIQASLRPDEALLSFYVGTGPTALWAVTSQRIQRYPLPPTAALNALAERFRSEVQSRRGSTAAGPLYRALFQNLDREFLSRSTWIVSAAEALFAIPWAALEVERDRGRPVYLLQQHVTLHTPSALMLERSEQAACTPRFVGLGDGIYNTADVRWRSRTAGFGWIQPGNKTGLQLARLAGSGAEIDACAARWAGAEQPLLLKGGDASRAALINALRTRPAIVHVAAHVVAPGSEHPEDSAIDLGLSADGRPDVLTSDDIAALDATNATVVLSGCSSAAAPSVSGKGVLGLTRAWLLAGARVVVGSRWPTPDDTGDLFQSFYQHLRNSAADADRTRAVARSLQAAQLQMLHSGTWRSSPWYWGAFYALGKE